MELFVLTLIFLSLAVAGLLYGVDSREPRNNWNRV